jgi:hypothetical protein
MDTVINADKTDSAAGFIDAGVAETDFTDRHFVLRHQPRIEYWSNDACP